MLVLILTAAAGAWTCALALNRLDDAKGYRVALAGAAVYLLSAGLISRLCLLLSPIPLAAFAVYPHLKRSTFLSFLGIGVANALGPAGAWVAVRSAVALLAGFCVLWAGASDLIQGAPDDPPGVKAELRSLPGPADRHDALWVSGAMQLLAAACLALLYSREFAGPWPLLGFAAVCVALIWEHENKGCDRALFFKVNATVGFLVLAFIGAGVLIPEP
jgi:4-hydroxybenzoate polyprenyltransferase